MRPVGGAAVGGLVVVLLSLFPVSLPVGEGSTDVEQLETSAVSGGAVAPSRHGAHLQVDTLANQQPIKQTNNP